MGLTHCFSSAASCLGRLRQRPRSIGSSIGRLRVTPRADPMGYCFGCFFTSLTLVEGKEKKREKMADSCLFLFLSPCARCPLFAYFPISPLHPHRGIHQTPRSHKEESIEARFRLSLPIVDVPASVQMEACPLILWWLAIECGEEEEANNRSTLGT